VALGTAEVLRVSPIKMASIHRILAQTLIKTENAETESASHSSEAASKCQPNVRRSTHLGDSVHEDTFFQKA
jgi:hypothetical protein